MCQRIDEQNLLNEYEVVFRQWEDLQIIEEVPKTEVDNFGYYLPHRPVMKQASQTMKIRPVFDASARDKSQPSLNDCLIDRAVPNWSIVRHREKAFLQLSIIPEHRDYLRFFLPNVEESKIYRHCRVVFGICSSPFQLSACIDHLLENSPARFDDVTQKLKHSFYVDNCVTGVTDIKEQESFINKAIEVLLQEAWKLKLKWDDALPENIQKIFRNEIVYLEKVNIPRYVEINENSELHLFVDACKSSYGACVYIRTVTPLGVKIRLIRAKSRVAPLKTMTIPRLESEPVSLPGDRVNDTVVFEVVGVDLAGPLYVKGGQKSWIVLFTCATYRAVHLELTSSLSTDAFLLSLRCFIARRGRPRVIYSDNGTNFRGAHGELSGIDWEKVLKLATIQRIIWKFNPPTAAWWGGWWERLVRVLKELLRRTLGNAILTTEELQTVLCDCESVINYRPLTYQSENSDDFVPLSPAMFLVENRNLDVPDIDYRDTVNLRKRVRYRQKLLNDLRHRFRKEYLGLLIQNKNKKGPLSEVRLGEIVLIGDDIKNECIGL
ncbi:integrase catalytic domain-containing protein [Trichonephila clavipes]|nr:integrase catalytic domain-containing protein [Trichonephila clavipes]